MSVGGIFVCKKGTPYPRQGSDTVLVETGRQMLPVFVTLVAVRTDHENDLDQSTLGSDVIDGARVAGSHGVDVLTGLGLGLSGGLVGGLDHVGLQFISHQR